MRKEEFIIKYYDNEKGGQDFFIHVFFKQYTLKTYLNRLVKWGEIVSYELSNLDDSIITVAANNEIGKETDEEKEVNLFDYLLDNAIEQAPKFHEEQKRLSGNNYYKPLWTKAQKSA